MSAALDAYVSYQKLKGNRPDSIRTTRHRLESILDGDDLVALVDVREANRAYLDLAGRVSVDTHRNTLGQVKTFWKWLGRQGHVRQNPWLDVEPMGRRKTGKEQLTIDEAKTLADYCLHARDRGAAASLSAMLLGLRAGEIARLTRSCIDGNGSILRVPGTKSAAAVRALGLPELLRPILEDNLPIGSRYQIRELVKRACRAAGVTEVGPHGLRGTHATLAASIGQTPLAVAQALGHAGTAVTERHYIAPGTVEAARQRAVLTVIQGGAKC